MVPLFVFCLNVMYSLLYSTPSLHPHMSNHQGLNQTVLKVRFSCINYSILHIFLHQILNSGRIIHIAQKCKHVCLPILLSFCPRYTYYVYIVCIVHTEKIPTYIVCKFIQYNQNESSIYA